VAGTTLSAYLAYRGYESLVGYCEGSPEIRAGGDSLSCLEPQHWLTVTAVLLVLVLFEVALGVVVGAAVVHQRRLRRVTA
jgi:hypothetical protein